MYKRFLLPILFLLFSAVGAHAQAQVDYGLGVGPSHQALIAWTASVTSDVTSYKIYRSNSSGSGYVLVGTVNVPTVSYLDKTVSAGKTYYYVVTAVDSSGESVNSSEISGTIPTP